MKATAHPISTLRRAIAVAGSTAILLLGTIPPSLAQYVPPQGQSAPRSGSTTTGAVRGGGCSAASTTGLVPFAPQTHVGQTRSTQPTFAWFTPETDPYPVEFRVAEHEADGQFRVVYSTEFVSTDKTSSLGITTVALSDTDVRLSPNQTYRWQVVLVCNPNRPSESLVAEADIRVVDAPPNLDTALAAATSVADRVDLYAASSLWYDAMTAALMADDMGAATLPAALLEDLATVEEQAHQTEDVVALGDRLRQVIAAIR